LQADNSANAELFLLLLLLLFQFFGFTDQTETKSLGCFCFCFRSLFFFLLVFDSHSFFLFCFFFLALQTFLFLFFGMLFSQLLQFVFRPTNLSARAPTGLELDRGSAHRLELGALCLHDAVGANSMLDRHRRLTKRSELRASRTSGDSGATTTLKLDESRASGDKVLSLCDHGFASAKALLYEHDILTKGDEALAFDSGHHTSA
jgi:hypothetical protein